MLDGPIADPALELELAATCALYTALARDLDPECGLGGKLVFAGELDAEGCRLVRAANIAGAASLAATADAARQRLAVREGVIDFLVNSLDEALRILKNEIRKRNAVAVGVSSSPAQVVTGMIERGVLPDLLRRECADEGAAFLAQGAQIVAPSPLPPGRVFLAVANPAAEFESRALAAIDVTDLAARRWVRLSPRYLGPQARRVRSLICDRSAAEETKAKS
jgi:hypothetical protein